MTDCTVNCPENPAVSPAGLATTIAQTARQWLRQQRVKAQIQSERQQLLALSDRELQDIGLDRAAALQEAARTDIPAGRGC